LKKAESILQTRDQLSPRYRRAIASSYFAMARCYYEEDRATFHELLDEAQRLSKSFARKQPFVYRTIATTFGPNVAERLATCKRRIRGANSFYRRGDF
jgi:hypothetical protein